MRFWKLSPLVGLILLFLALPGRAADAPPAYIGIHKPLTSTVMILVPVDRDHMSQGSGFVVDGTARLIVTNRHVVGEKDKASVIFPTYENGQARADRQYYLSRAARLAATVLARDARRDLALLKLNQMPAGTPALPLSHEGPHRDERVHASANPGKDIHAFVYTAGRVRDSSRLQLTYAAQRVNARFTEIATDKPLSPGASGGPVINDRGELVGVIAAGPNNGTPAALCIDVKEVRLFLGDAHRDLATTALEKKDYDKAIAYCNRALEFNAIDSLTFNERGVAYSYQGRFDKAIADYNTALRLDPTLKRAFRNRGSAYYHTGKYAKTVSDCTEALRLDPNYARAYLWRSMALTKLGKTTAARTDYAKAVKLDPSLR